MPNLAPEGAAPEAEEIQFANEKRVSDSHHRPKRPSIHVSPPESKRSQRLSVTLFQPPSDLVDPVIEK